MNYPLNSALIETEFPFLISKNPPPDFILPAGITFLIYHPLHLDGRKEVIPDQDTKIQIMEFIREHDCTGGGGVAELSS